MKIILLESIHYPPKDVWKSVPTAKPEWSEIETALRRLDRNEWPFIWLHTQESPKNEMPENMLCVMGGRGEYQLTLFKDGNEIGYRNQSREKGSIQIWKSDQGSEALLKNLCDDVELALRLTRTFCQTGQLDSSAEWKAE